jgi:hypothetical protein
MFNDTAGAEMSDEQQPVSDWQIFFFFGFFGLLLAYVIHCIVGYVLSQTIITVCMDRKLVLEMAFDTVRCVGGAK